MTYNWYEVDTIAVTTPPNEIHTARKVAADGVTLSPNNVTHYIANKPITAFYILSQKSTFRGMYICPGNGEPVPHPFRHTSLGDYGRLLEAGGSGDMVGD